MLRRKAKRGKKAKILLYKNGFFPRFWLYFLTFKKRGKKEIKWLFFLGFGFFFPERKRGLLRTLGMLQLSGVLQPSEEKSQDFTL